MPTHNGDLKVRLGCGTLILIVIIVLIFSGGNDSRELKREVGELKNAVSNLQNEIRALRSTLENQQRPRHSPPQNQ